MEKMKKPNEAIRYFEKLMRPPRTTSVTSRLGYVKYLSSDEQGESSKKGEQRNVTTKPKNKKPTLYYCRKLGHMTNVYRSNIGKSNHNPKFTGYFFN